MASDVSDQPPSHRPTRNLRILVVDDEVCVLKAFSRLVRQDGHQVTAADGGQAAIDMFVAADVRGEPFALVFLDLQMPHVNGHMVAAAIKAMSPLTPVVLVTGQGGDWRAQGGLPANVDRLLHKPADADELRSAVADLVVRPTTVPPRP
jgi:CheY-like chemotaxis protein